MAEALSTCLDGHPVPVEGCSECPYTFGPGPYPDIERIKAQARIMGVNRAHSEMAAKWTGPDDTPLSGEWADDPVMATLARSLGVPAPVTLEHAEDGCAACTKFGADFDIYAERCVEIAAAYEIAYAEAWETGL